MAHKNFSLLPLKLPLVLTFLNILILYYGTCIVITMLCHFQIKSLFFGQCVCECYLAWKKKKSTHYHLFSVTICFIDWNLATIVLHKSLTRLAPMNKEKKIKDSMRKIQRKQPLCRKNYKCSTRLSRQSKEQDVRISDS